MCPDEEKGEGVGQVNKSYTVAGIVICHNDERGIEWHCNCSDVYGLPSSCRVVLPDTKKDGVAEQLSFPLITTIPYTPCCHQVTHTNDRKTNLVDLANSNGNYDLFHILQC